MPEYPGESPDAASLVPHTHAESDVTSLAADLAARLVKASNLSDVANASTVRTNLGLGTAAVADKVAAGAAGVLDATDPTTTNARTPTAHTHVEGDVTSLVADLALKAAKASNLSDLASASTARTNLGLGSAALNATGDFLQKADATGKGGLWVATGNGSYAFHAAGNDGETPIWDSSAADGVRNAVLTEAKAYNGLLGWTFDPVAATGTVTPSAATLYVCKIPLRRQISVTNVLHYLNGVGTTLTHAYALLHKSDGTLIGQSADQSSGWSSGGSGLRTNALAGGPFTVTPLGANDFVWGAVYVGTAAAVPTWIRANAAIALVDAGTTGASSRFGSLAIADTATPGSITPANVVATSGVGLWMGLS